MALPEDLQELLDLPETPVFFIASTSEGSGNVNNEDGESVERTHVTDNVIIAEEMPTWYQCTVCEKRFRTKAHIWYHEFCGKEGDDKPFKCPECGMGFVSKSHFQYHLRKHTGERPFVCGVCDKGFSLKGKLNRHMNTHRQHSCEECGKTFPKKEHLRLHMALHTDERPFKCKTCSKEFKYETNLKRHQLTHADASLEIKYTSSGSGRHACSKCNRGFQLFKDLQRHELIHTGEKPFECDSCESRFARKDHLERHIQSIHKGIKQKSNKGKLKTAGISGKKRKNATPPPPPPLPHVCKECSRGFKMLKDLQRHELIHSDEKPFKCDICGCKFRRKDNRDRHAKTHKIPSISPKCELLKPVEAGVEEKLEDELPIITEGSAMEI